MGTSHARSIRHRVASIGTAAILALIMVAPTVVFAGENVFGEARFQTEKVQHQAGVPERDLETVIGSIIKAALSIAGVLFFGYIVWAGYLWMTAHGEEEKITQAKKMISGGVIGLAIILA
ncbi:MAG: pilin, partial [bacterium]|nr:pilin [bacterium]